MFYINELRFIKEILAKKHINSYVFSSSKTNELKIAQEVYGGILTQESFEQHFSELKDNTIYRVIDSFYCRYLFLKLPQSESAVFLVGPYTLQNITHDDLIQISEKINLPSDKIKSLEYQLSSVPFISDESYIFSIINTFCELLWGGKDNFNFKDISDKVLSLSTFYPSNESLKTNDLEEDMKFLEERYKYENEIIDAIINGHIHKAELILSSFSSLSFEKRNSDQLRNLKNYCIITNTLFRKAAEKGGVHPFYINLVSSDIAEKIEQISSQNEVPKFILKTFKTYCKLVKDNSNTHYSPLIEKVIIIIESDLTTDLTLSKLAKKCNVSSGYLSAVFKKETNQTLTNFVNHRRIAEAKKLLNSTNLQIQTIAQHCGILDVPYFSKLFKKYVGVSPKQYKEK